MSRNPNLRNAALATALVAVTATAWATSEYVGPTAYSDPVQAPMVSQAEPIAAPAESATVMQTLSPNETVVVPAEPTAVQSQPPLVVEDRRMTEDQRIQAQVMDMLAQASNISGKIGVESHGAVVTLTGYTVTAAQGQRAGRYAGSVDGVKSVNNELRARVGGSVL